MRHLSSSSLCATVAISAALALGSTPAFAQEATPSIVLPPAASAPPAQPAAPAPTIALPPAEPVAAAEPAPKPAPRAERRAPRTAEAPRAGAEQAAASTATPDSVPAPAAEPIAPVPMKMPVAAQPDAPVAEAPQPDSVRRELDVPDEVIAASVLGVLGLGIAGFVATRRRRRDEAGYGEVHEADPADAPTTSIPDELAVRPQERVDAVPAPAATGSAFVMPGGPVPSGDARERLIDEMVAAEPDEANPFTSAKARRKRARILLQAREHDQRQQATEPFDWRTYRSPTHLDPTTPPKVDA